MLVDTHRGSDCNSRQPLKRIGVCLTAFVEWKQLADSAETEPVTRSEGFAATLKFLH